MIRLKDVTQAKGLPGEPQQSQLAAAFTWPLVQCSALQDTGQEALAEGITPRRREIWLLLST